MRIDLQRSMETASKKYRYGMVSVGRRYQHVLKKYEQPSNMSFGGFLLSAFLLSLIHVNYLSLQL